MNTVPSIPAAKARTAKTRPAIPAAMKRNPTLIFKMPVEEMEEKEPGRYSIIHPKV